MRFPLTIRLTGHVKCWDNCLFGVKEVVDSMHGNRKKILVKVFIDPEQTVSKNKVVHQRYEEIYLD